MYTIKLFFRFWSELLLSLILFRSIKVFVSNDLTIGLLKLYRSEVVFPHPVGIVIGTNVSIGKKCTIYQNVTIGTKDTENFITAPYPKIGNNVTIFPNSIIIGGICIGDNAVIGAGSVVLNDVPANSVAVGCPARILK